MKLLLVALSAGLVALGFVLWVKEPARDAPGGSATESRIRELPESEENCLKVDGATDLFLAEVSRDLKVPPGALQVRGATYGATKAGTPRCLVHIEAPYRTFRCAAHRLLSDDGGKTAYAQGHGRDRDRGNGTCEDHRS